MSRRARAWTTADELLKTPTWLYQPSPWVRRRVDPHPLSEANAPEARDDLALQEHQPNYQPIRDVKTLRHVVKR
jgi:hypothetical protein